MEKALRGQLNVIFSRNGITVSDIAAAGFGLAGADLPWQIDELKKRVEAIGFTRYGLANDGILGIKTENGVGLCAVNGTGTVVIGADERGEILQVGGVGQRSGCNAGGTYIRDRIITLLYEFYYRCGTDSAMFPPVMELLQAKPDDLLSVICDYELLHRHMTEIIKIGERCALDGDEAAKYIFDSVGESIGKSAAGCIRNLSFENTGTIDVVQVGSVWKTSYEGMNAAFLKTTQELSGKKCRCIQLKTSAAAGGVLWAKEIFDGTIPTADYRRRLINRLK
jgi:N-acetylglucosamine kinase-like BadF-type ATPase